jgi:hypothetical protein
VQSIPAAAHETVKRRPISLAKLSERGSGKLRVNLASSGGDNHAPMGRSEWIALAMDSLGQSFHVRGVSEPPEKNKSRKKITISCSTASAVPL